MLRTTIGLLCVLSLVVLTSNCVGPAGPPGAAGASASGPPYVWICTPAAYDSEGFTHAQLFVFNGSATTANVAVNILNRFGSNLAGVAPFSFAAGTTFPGQTGTDTVPVTSGHTLVVNYESPHRRSVAGNERTPLTVRVVSDQPIAVGSNIPSNSFNPPSKGFHPLPCSLLPK